MQALVFACDVHIAFPFATLAKMLTSLPQTGSHPQRSIRSALCVIQDSGPQKAGNQAGERREGLAPKIADPAKSRHRGLAFMTVCVA